MITAIDGIGFDEAWANHIEVCIDGIQVPVLGRNDLILMSIRRLLERLEGV